MQATYAQMLLDGFDQKALDVELDEPLPFELGPDGAKLLERRRQARRNQAGHERLSEIDKLDRRR